MKGNTILAWTAILLATLAAFDRNSTEVAIFIAAALIIAAMPNSKPAPPTNAPGGECE